MIQFFQNLYLSFINYIDILFDEIFQFFTELWLIALDTFLSGIATIIESIPTPTFLTNGISFYLNGIDPSVLYFLSRSGLTEGFAILGLGLTFRLLRKLATLGQW